MDIECKDKKTNIERPTSNVEWEDRRPAGPLAAPGGQFDGT
jgi:hypothetical protein